MLQMLNCLIAALEGVYLSQLVRPSDAPTSIAKPVLELRPSAVAWISGLNEAWKGGIGA